MTTTDGFDPQLEAIVRDEFAWEKRLDAAHVRVSAARRPRREPISVTATTDHAGGGGTAGNVGTGSGRRAAPPAARRAPIVTLGSFRSGRLSRAVLGITFVAVTAAALADIVPVVRSW
jgi:hypothetical protein